MISLYSIPRVTDEQPSSLRKSPSLLLQNRLYKTVQLTEDELENENNIYVFGCKAVRKKSLFLGGDGSITYPLVKAFRQVYGDKNTFLIVIDNHMSCYPSSSPVTFEESLYAIINQANFKRRNIALLGATPLHSEESDFLEQEKAFHIPARVPTEEEMISLIDSASGKKVYISINMNVLNPRTKYGKKVKNSSLEPRILLYYVKELLEHIDVISGDIVGYNLNQDEKGEQLDIAKKVISLISDYI